MGRRKLVLGIWRWILGLWRYLPYFKGRYLYIVTDCCYSGAWVVECARLLDEDDIKCGHDAKRKQVYIKVFTACLLDEQAHNTLYTKCNGVKFDDHSKSIMFAEHRKLHPSLEQTTLGVDFTRDNLCTLDRRRRCIHRSSWTEDVQCLLRQNSSDCYLL